MGVDALTEKLGEIEGSVKTFIERNNSKVKELAARTQVLEQAAVGHAGPGGWTGLADKSIGQQLIESDGFAAVVKGARSSGRMAFKSLTSPEAKAVTSGTWSTPLWMWRKQWDYEQLKKFGPHAGKPGTGVGVLVEHRANELSSPPPFNGEFELAIMIEVADRRDAWVGLSSRPETD